MCRDSLSNHTKSEYILYALHFVPFDKTQVVHKPKKYRLTKKVQTERQANSSEAKESNKILLSEVI